MSLRPMTDDEKMDIEVGRMVRKVAGDPKTRGDLYRTLKKSDPSINWPDQDLEDFKREMRDNAEKDKEDRKIDDAKRALEQKRLQVHRKFGTEHLKAIEALMVKHGIWDYDVAIKLYRAEQPEPTPTKDYPNSGRWDPPSDKELIADPSKWANEMAHRVIKEFRQNTLPRR